MTQIPLPKSTLNLMELFNMLQKGTTIEEVTDELRISSRQVYRMLKILADIKIKVKKVQIKGSPVFTYHVKKDQELIF